MIMQVRVISKAIRIAPVPSPAGWHSQFSDAIIYILVTGGFLSVHLEHMTVGEPFLFVGTVPLTIVELKML